MTSEYRLLREYGLTPQAYDDLLTKQRGRCAICRQKVELHVDHNHETGCTRGLLCHGCNLGLGGSVTTQSCWMQRPSTWRSTSDDPLRRSEG